MASFAIPSVTPCCGVAPSPADIAQGWNFDVVLIAVLLGLLVAYLVQARRGPAPLPRWRVGCFCAGWLVALIVLVSPLCALAVALFSARMAAHMLLVVVSAPLAALGRLTRPAYRSGGPGAGRRRAYPLPAAAAFAAALWFWHAPGPYAASFTSDATFWCMQITLYATALWFWAALLDRSSDQLADFVAATCLTAGQMALLGAMLIFAGRSLYTPHLTTTQVWGLTPLQDQQWGGIALWIPAGAIFVVGLGGALVSVMRRSEERRRAGAMAA